VILERSWVLFFLLLPLGLAVWQWKRAYSRLGLTLKAIALTAVILALAEPRIDVLQNKIAAAVLVDTSASITPADLLKANTLVRQLEGARDRNWMRVIPFARSSRLPTPAEAESSGGVQASTGESGRGTDIEAALRDAVAALPSDMLGRIVLISDGQETEGSAARGASMAKQLGVQVDTIPLEGHPAPLLRIESVSAPGVAFAGERFPVTLVINSPNAAKGTIELAAEGKAIGNKDVTLQAGSNVVRVQTSLNVTGAVEVSGVVRSGEVGNATFEQAVTLRKPRVLFLSQDPEGSEAHLLNTLKAAQFDVQRSTNIGATFSDYQIVVLNNWDLEAIPSPRKEALERYAKNGGGLLVIGGEHNVYAENKNGPEDPLERVLPAKLAPPRSPEGTCVVLIMDKSSSMEGRKMELARLSAIGLIDNVRPADFVGVLIFDNSFQWAVPIRRAEDKGTIKRLISGIFPDGGTQIAPALAEAYRRIQRSNATFRHILLLTDGISEEGDSITLSKEANAQRITISTVGLGQDVNRPYLEKIASNAKGRSYFLTDPSGLEQILVKDMIEHTGSTAIEKDIIPTVSKPSVVLDGINMTSAPPLGGYVKFVSKTDADTVLTMDGKDPLLAIWQAGLGRSAVFASDAKSRWAEKWVGWNGFDRFWLNLFRDLLPHAQAGETNLSYDPASSSLVAEYRISPQITPPERIPDIFVIGPNGFQAPLPVKKIADRAWRGTLPIGDRKGLFRVRTLQESALFPETGLYRQEGEMLQYGNDQALLRQLARFTGGRFSPTPAQVFEPGDRYVGSSMVLWPGLLAFAIFLNIVELVIRKWRSLRDVFIRPRAVVSTS
jgi:Ca-activated chloride channel family protein